MPKSKLLRRALAAVLIVGGLTLPVAAGTIVRMDTVLGDIDIELLDTIAPNTVANFLKYVTDGDYINTIVHRSVPNFVIQGGGFTTEFSPVPTDPPVVNEFNVSNTRGTVAMARQGGKVNSATNQWFINLKDNTGLDTVDEGFTVFGRVIGNGMQVADAIAQLPVFNGGAPFNEIPLRNYDNQSQVGLENLVVIEQVTVLGAIAEQFPWRNAALPTDVNASGTVTPLDALLVINELNAAGSHALARPAPPGLPPPFLDVSGDDWVKPLDALLVINALNEMQSQAVQGQPAAVPEPTGWLLAATALAVLIATRRLRGGLHRASLTA